MRISTFVITSEVRDFEHPEFDFAKFVYESLHKFQCHNWGDTYEEDGYMNDTALQTGERIIAVYEPPKYPQYRIWIIAEATDAQGKRVVTILFPHEY